MTRPPSRVATLVAAALLAACGITPPAPPQPLDATMAEVDADADADADRAFVAAAADAPRPGPDDLAWWRRFDDPSLADWVESALARNLDLAQARARIDESRALLRAAQAGRGPRVAAQAGIAASSRSGSDGRRVEPSAGLTLDWDADLWGGFAAAEAAASARVGEREALLQAARLSTAALTARAVVAWRESLLARRQLLDSIVLQREIVRVVQVRVDAGLSPALDGQRARGELAATEAAAVAASTRVASAERALQLLAGERPGRPLPGSDAATPKPLPQLRGEQPVVLPTDLLRLRPDLLAAEQSWRAAVAGLGVADAARRPSLRLPGALMLGTASGGALLAQVTASVAAALVQPLFDGGLRDADRDAAAARVREAALVYRQTLQQALADVEAALRAGADSRLRLQAQQRAVDEADAAVRDADTLYRSGLAGFLDLLDAQRSALARRQALLVARGDAARAAIAGFEAMGLIAGPGADPTE